MSLVSILLPIYNERDNLRPLLDEIEAAMEPTGDAFEVIAVDDGSSDGSAELLRELAAKRRFLKVILFRRNSGQTAALDAGFRHATGDVIVTMDADRQNDPRDIPKLLAKLREGFDCVSGWRKKRHDGFFLRRLPSLVANRFVRWYWKSSVADLGCTLKAYRRDITEELSLYGEMHRFIGILLEGLGAKVASIEVNHRPRVAGKSKYNLTRVVKVALDLITIWFLQTFRTKPIHVFGGIGLGCFTLSFASECVAVWQKLQYDFSLNRNPLFTLGVFLVVIGVQFIVLGLLAELLIRNYFESTGRVPYSVREKIGFARAKRRAA